MEPPIIHDMKMYARNQLSLSIVRKSGRHSDCKCGQMLATRGKVIQTDRVVLPEGRIANIQDSYKYLSISSANMNHAKDVSIAKYSQKVRQRWKSQLNNRNKIQAINTYHLLAVRHLAGIIRWSQQKINATDVRT